MELHLQVKLMWETIKTQSLLENCALLLKNHELASYLIFNHGCRIAEMAKQLQLTETELSGIIELIPLSDLEIANFLLERFQLKATPAAIRKARQRATDQLRQAVKGKQLTKKNGRTSENGKT